MTRPLRNLISAVTLAALTGLLVLAATQWTDVFFRFYPAFSRWILGVLAGVTSVTSFPIWEPGLCLIVLWGVISLIRSLVRHHFLRWLSGLLLTLCGAAFFFMAVWGLNYFAPPMSDRLGLETQERTPAELREVTSRDELALDTLGDRKTALFLIMSDTDSTFNFIISMVYTQLFNLLCEAADDVYGGRLPVHVRCLIDEAANIGQIPNLEKLMATIRSREISACLVLQAQSQLKALYKDNADTIIGNCDSRLFLGGSEPSTLKELSQSLGKETIDTYNTGESRGRETSHSLNYQKLGRELMSVDDLATLDGGKCILQIRGLRPFLSDKYDITKHPNYKYLSDADPKNTFDVEKYMSHRLKLKADEEYDVYEIVPDMVRQ